jgi:hypothetical protein
MSDDALRGVLRLVADGRLTVEEAGPILAALDEAAGAAETARGNLAGSTPPPPQPPPDAPPPPPGPGVVRIEVTESGDQVVNLRLPLALGRFALDRVPGLSADHAARVREALEGGIRGPVLEVSDEDGSVRIVVE